VIGELFPELSAEVSDSSDAPDLRLTLEQSGRVVAAGNRVTVIANGELPPGVHAYTSGVLGYKPIQLVMHPESGVEFSPVTPNSEALNLGAIN
jgi:hypothetical protein